MPSLRPKVAILLGCKCLTMLERHTFRIRFILERRTRNSRDALIPQVCITRRSLPGSELKMKHSWFSWDKELETEIIHESTVKPVLGNFIDYDALPGHPI